MIGAEFKDIGSSAYVSECEPNMIPKKQAMPTCKASAEVERVNLLFQESHGFNLFFYSCEVCMVPFWSAGRLADLIFVFLGQKNT